MDKVIYTAIFSNYENLKEPTVVQQGWRFICYTDQPLQSDTWEIVPTAIEPGLTPQRMARKIKITYWEQWDESLWLDASFQVNMDLNLLWQNYFRAPFTAPKHPLRTDVYHEIQSCIANNRGTNPDEKAQTIRELYAQEAAYKQAGVPNFGNNIITSGLLMRSKGCEELCREWYDELCRYSVRDQVAFARVSIGREFHTFNWDYSQSKEIKYIRHYHERN